jgi:polyhydroxyalkanoate synthesis regulator phasin
MSLGCQFQMTRNQKNHVIVNDVEMTIEEAFKYIDEGMEANVEVINNALNEINLGERGADTMEKRMKELRKQHAEEIREYKARIFELENQVATLTMGRLVVQVVHQLTFSLWKRRWTQL